MIERERYLESEFGIQATGLLLSRHAEYQATAPPQRD